MPLDTNNNKIIIAIMSLAITIQAVLSFGYWVGGDQLHLLDLGTKLVGEGELLGYSKLKTGGGMNLGSLMQLLVAGPLFLWESYLSPMIVPLVFSVISFFVARPVIQDAYGSKGVFLFALFFFLSPTRIYNSAFLWEPAYLFLFMALHFYSSYQLMKNGSSFKHSFIVILSLICMLQIHNSALIMIIASLWLLLRKQIKYDVKGSLAAFLVGGLFFLPLLFDLSSIQTAEVDESTGYIGKSLITVAPFLKSIFYMIKLSGFDTVRAIKESNIDSVLLRVPLQLLSVITVVIAIVANWLYFKKYRKSSIESVSAPKTLLFSYWKAVFLGLIISGALSPITLQEWMVVIVMIASSLPMIDTFSSDNILSRKSKLIYILFSIVSISSLSAVYFGQDKFNSSGKTPDYKSAEMQQRISPLF
jgi:hypothetical protein